MASALVASFESDFEPEKFTDEYQVQLRTLIDAKLEHGDAVDTAATFGEEPDEEKEDVAEVIDLMEVLRRSVERSRGSGSSGTSGTSGGDSAGDGAAKSLDLQAQPGQEDPGEDERCEEASKLRCLRHQGLRLGLEGPGQENHRACHRDQGHVRLREEDPGEEDGLRGAVSSAVCPG